MEVATTDVPENHPAGARLTENDTLRCPLQEGETTFVLKIRAQPSSIISLS